MSSKYTNNDRVDNWKSRSINSSKKKFIYTWFHATTGRRGIGTILMQSAVQFENWISRWNHQGLGEGWNYSVFDASI